MTHTLSAIAQIQPFQERLSGELVLDAMGNPTQPSGALPFETDDPVPTMLVQRELNYLHWLASRLEGKGRVVELGCFLGGSTSALAAGLRLNERSLQSILTYDCFEIPPETHPFPEWLRPFGLKPAHRFRDKYDQLNRGWLDIVSVRDGWIPSDATTEQEHEVYPEQEPIELLFVDAAKTWDVDLTILRAFGRHLHEGATIVQQDFCDLHVPWIPLHMWQLRDVLEPLDVLEGTPTISFKCTTSIVDRLAGLWAKDDLQDRKTRKDVWSQVYEYWSEIIGESAAGFLHGHAATHALHSEDSDEFTRYGRMYDAWSRSLESRNIYFTPGWPDGVARMPEVFESLSMPSKAVRTLSTECLVRGSRLDRPREGEHATYYTAKQRVSAWAAAQARIQTEGHQKVAMFGAGKHTRWLFDAVDFGDDIEIVCIIDDSSDLKSVCDIPVLSPDDAEVLLSGVTAILPSSDSFEREIFDRLIVLYQDVEGLEVYRVYTHADAKLNFQRHRGNLCPQWSYEIDCAESKSDLNPISDLKNLENEVVEREQLGLPSGRGWLDIFYERYAVPNWSVGYTIQSDAAFLWDIIEAVHPRRVVEIGTASGISTAMILGAIDQFCDHDSKVYSYDVTTRCYFDADRAVASALGEMTPDLLPKARIYAPADAVDAATHFGIGEIDFAFIDGDHSHPSPTLDLLSLLYALKPGAWVALHDIELSNLRSASGEREWQHVTGAEKLFHDWPFEKLQAAGSCPEERNIGAIRMPENLEDAVPHLLDLLRKPWETHAQPSPAVAKALAKLAEFGE